MAKWSASYRATAVDTSQAFGVSVTQVATTFNDMHGVPVPPTNADSLPNDLAIEFSGEGTVFPTPEAALKGE